MASGLETGSAINGVSFDGNPDILMVSLAAGAGDAGDRIEVRLDGVSGTKIAELTIAKYRWEPDVL